MELEEKKARRELERKREETELRRRQMEVEATEREFDKLDNDRSSQDGGGMEPYREISSTYRERRTGGPD